MHYASVSHLGLEAAHDSMDPRFEGILVTFLFLQSRIFSIQLKFPQKEQIRYLKFAREKKKKKMILLESSK